MLENQARKPKKILWVSNLILDVHLYKTSQIEILRELAKRGHKIALFALHSSNKNLNGLENVNVISIPLRYISSLSTTAYIFIVFIYG